MPMQQKLTLSGKTIEGNTVVFPAPLELDYREDRFVPCAALDFALPLPEDGAEYCEVAAALDGVPLFEGIVDRQIIEKSGDGNRLLFECRSKTALLLDNEVKPSIFFQLSSSQVFLQYAKPNGVLGERFPYVAKRSYLQVNKGSSSWDVLEQFCWLAYRQQPFITRERVLVLEPDTGVTRTLSNQRAGAIPYTRLTVRQKNDRVISRLYTRTSASTQNPYYGVVLDNPEAKRRCIRRERYHNPVTDSNQERKDEAQRILDESNREGFEAELLIPGIHAVETGDLVLLPDEPIRQDLMISGVRYRASDAGVTTTLTLTVRG